MTTIVLKDGMLAADGMTSIDGGVISRQAKKVFSVPESSKIFGERVMGFALCGDISDSNTIMSAINAGLSNESKVAPQSSFSAIVVTDSSRFGITSARGSDTVEIWKIEETYYSMGSGSVHAFAYIRAIPDCTAVDAVRFATEWDCYTGGEITSLDTNK